MDDFHRQYAGSSISTALLPRQCDLKPFG